MRAKSGKRLYSLCVSAWLSLLHEMRGALTWCEPSSGRPDPLRSRAQILLSLIVDKAWNDGWGLTLPDLSSFTRRLVRALLIE
jgi:hypothetical protein